MSRVYMSRTPQNRNNRRYGMQPLDSKRVLKAPPLRDVGRHQRRNANLTREKEHRMPMLRDVSSRRRPGACCVQQWTRFDVPLAKTGEEVRRIDDKTLHWVRGARELDMIGPTMAYLCDLHGNATGVYPALSWATRRRSYRSATYR